MKPASELFNEYREGIFYLCMGIVHDRALAEDLTQEAFLQAFEHINELRSEASFKPWIYRIAKNLALSELRKKRALGTTLEFKEEIGGREESGYGEVQSKEFYAALFRAIKTLTDEQRAVFELYDIQKLSHKEISRLLKIPEGTSRSRLHHARRRVKEGLKSAGF